MNKVLKIFVIIICTTIALLGIVYATTVIYNKYIKNIDPKDSELYKQFKDNSIDSPDDYLKLIIDKQN